MLVNFDSSSMQDYEKFLRLKRTPAYSWRGLRAVVPDEYAHHITGEKQRAKNHGGFIPSEFCMDYQADIAAMAVRKEKFAVFADCGLGKTIISLEFARHVRNVESSGRLLMIAPLMVVEQTLEECQRFYGDGLPIAQVAAKDLQGWLNGSEFEIGITNYEAIRDDIKPGNLRGLILDESSNLKSHYGAWGTRLIEMGQGLRWKLAMTGTPAPNDRIEYANHAVFCDHFRTTHEFLARYFVNKGKTQERWILKPHALQPFYRDLSHWCIFLTDPSVYGWQDNTSGIPPIHVHIERVDLTPEQQMAVQKLTGKLMVSEAGGIGQRSKLMQIAKGKDGIPSNKPKRIRELIESWPDESTIIWCHFNDEQDRMERLLPEAASISGSTPMNRRRELIADFTTGRVKVLISKPKVLGFGLNLQVATRQIFNGMNDSYEDFYQAVKRSNRIGSTRPLNVHIPITEIEEPMVSNVLRKAHRIDKDTREQEEMFRQSLTVMQGA